MGGRVTEERDKRKRDIRKDISNRRTSRPNGPEGRWLHSAAEALPLQGKSSDKMRCCRKVREVTSVCEMCVLQRKWFMENSLENNGCWFDTLSGRLL